MYYIVFQIIHYSYMPKKGGDMLIMLGFTTQRLFVWIVVTWVNAKSSSWNK